MNDVLPWSREDMVLRQVSIPKQHVVFVRGVFEASDGVAFVTSAQGGELTIVASRSRSTELAQILDDLREELGDSWAEVQPTAPAVSTAPAERSAPAEPLL